MDLKGNNFKIGDKVLVKNNLKEIKDFAGEYVEDLEKYIGKIFTIKRFNNGGMAVKFEEDTTFSFDLRCLEKATINTPKDLKFGDIVTTRNNERYVVADGSLYGESENYIKDCVDVDNYEDDFRWFVDEDSETDIIKVERSGLTIWKREESEVKEMTIKEISEALGYDVKVVK